MSAIRATSIVRPTDTLSSRAITKQVSSNCGGQCTIEPIRRAKIEVTN